MKKTSISHHKSNPAEIEWVKVAAGGFLYGDDKVKRTIEQPFLIGKYPVTNAQYKNFLDANLGQAVPAGWDKDKRVYPAGKAAHPVVGIWRDNSVAFCEWNGCRLPTEEEWEKAARGDDGRTYPWGDEIDSSFANYDKAMAGTTAVGEYPKGISPDGALDMAGNVWEWTASLYDERPWYYVLRGGSWFNPGIYLRVAFRLHDPTPGDGPIGFRCAASV